MKIRMFNFTCFPVVSTLPKIVIAYEDAETRLRVTRGLAAALGTKARIAEWKFSLLEYPGMLREALADASTAEAIIIAAHGNCDLPDAVKNWIDQWSRLKNKGGGNLFAVLDPANEGELVAERIFGHLMRAADAADFEWFPTFFDEFDMASNHALT